MTTTRHRAFVLAATLALSPGLPTQAQDDPAAAADGAPAQPFRANPEEFEAGLAALKEQDYDAAHTTFLVLAAQGDAEAQYQLASLYHRGLGDDTDPWNRRGGAASDSLGQGADLAAAARWYEEAASQGHAAAQYALGNMHLMGEGVEQDDGKAAGWHEKAAAQGHAAARLNLAKLQQIGKRKTAAELREEARQAALEETPDAPALTAAEQAAAQPEPQQAIAAKTQNAKKKRGFFKRLLGRDKPEAIPAPAPSATTVAAAPAPAPAPAPKPASGQAGAVSNHALGLAYALGDGVEQDSAKAFEHFVKAAQAGYAPAQYRAGLALAYGEGVDKDLARAVEWYEKAALQGHAIARRNLGLIYQNGGPGVAQDASLALAWFELLASADANQIDIHRRDSLRQSMAPDAIEEAERLKAQLQERLADATAATPPS